MRFSVPNPIQFLEHMQNGLVSGALLISVALGLSIIFGLLGIVNFAHGLLFALGAYMAVTLSGLLGFSLNLIVAPIIVAIIAIAIEIIFLRRFYTQDPIFGLLFTFGLALAGTEAIQMIWGPAGRPYRLPEVFRGAVEIAAFTIPIYRILVVAITALAIAALWWFLNKTPIGVTIRAGTRDPEMVRMLGIGLRPRFTLVFGIGAALAALAGVLNAPIGGVQPAMGENILTLAFVIVVIGGLGSFWGTVVAGMLVGLVTALTTVYWPPMAEASAFILMVIVLLLWPRGLFGEEWEAFE